MALITLGTLRDYWKKVSDWVDGTDAVSAPKVTVSGSLPAFAATPNVNVTGSNVEGAPGAAAPSKAVQIAGKSGANSVVPDVGAWGSGSGLYGASAIAAATALFAEGSGAAQRLQVDSQKNLLVGLRSSAGLEPGIALPANGSSNSTGLEVTARPMRYNGASWDVEFSNTEGTLLASAARTTSTWSALQSNYNGEGVVLALEITANPGGAETLTLWLFDMPDGSTMPWAIAKLTVQAAVNTTYQLMVCPGASATPENPTYNKAYALPVVRSWKGYVEPSGAGSWTYSLKQSTKV